MTGDPPPPQCFRLHEVSARPAGATSLAREIQQAADGADDVDSSVDREPDFSELLQSGKRNSRCARTIKRDIDFMRDRLELPVEFDSKRNGYYFTRPVPQLPQLPIVIRLICPHFAHTRTSLRNGEAAQQPVFKGIF